MAKSGGGSQGDPGTECYPGLGLRVKRKMPEMEMRDVHTVVPEGKAE